jgi:hypothetical protein
MRKERERERERERKRERERELNTFVILCATIFLFYRKTFLSTQKDISREIFDEFYSYESLKMALIAGAITVVANQL